jgi:hypothetical protein
LAAPVSARGEAEKGIDSILSVLKDKNLAPDERREKLRIIVEDFVDFDTLSRLSIGRSGKSGPMRSAMNSSPNSASTWWGFAPSSPRDMTMKK